MQSKSLNQRSPRTQKAQRFGCHSETPIPRYADRSGRYPGKHAQRWRLALKVNLSAAIATCDNADVEVIALRLDHVEDGPSEVTCQFVVGPPDGFDELDVVAVLLRERVKTVHLFDARLLFGYTLTHVWQQPLCLFDPF
jgi:hypothetical protein